MTAKAGTWFDDPPRIKAQTEAILRCEPSVSQALRYSETVREWTKGVCAMVDDVRNEWDAIPPATRAWLRLWALDELPPPKHLPGRLVSRLLARAVGTIVEKAQPHDSEAFMREMDVLRDAILTQVAQRVWKYTLQDEAFAHSFAMGIQQADAGEAVPLRLDDV